MMVLYIYIIKHLKVWILSLCLTLLLNALSIYPGFARELPDAAVWSLKERIQFSVKWSFIPLLKTHMETYRLGGGKDPIVYRLIHQAASNAFWNDRMASIIDSQSLLPYRVETILRDGKKLSKQSIIFERDLGKALFSFQERRSGRRIVDTLDITEESMDPLSAFYYLRKRLSLSDPFSELRGITGSRRFLLRGRLVGEENIEVPAGNFKTYRLECNLEYWPQSSKGSPNDIKVEKKENNPFTLWVSQDHHRFPVQIRYHLPFGSLWVRAISLQTYDTL